MYCSSSVTRLITHGYSCTRATSRSSSATPARGSPTTRPSPSPARERGAWRGRQAATHAAVGPPARGARRRRRTPHTTCGTRPSRESTASLIRHPSWLSCLHLHLISPPSTAPRASSSMSSCTRPRAVPVGCLASRVRRLGRGGVVSSSPGRRLSSAVACCGGRPRTQAACGEQGVTPRRRVRREGGGRALRHTIKLRSMNGIN